WDKIVVHNPLPYRRREVVEIAVAFPRNWGEQTGFQYVDALWHGERYNKFHLVDFEGNRIAYQLRNIVRGLEVHRLDEFGRRMMQSGDYYHLAVELDLPACGSLSLQVEGTCDGTRNFGTLRTAPLRAENEHLTFELAADGTGTLTDKGSGLTFSGLFQYEDAGDGGDGWCRGPLVDDIRYVSPGASVMTAIEEDGPLRTVFRVERRFFLPREMNRHTWSRTEDRETLRVTDFIAIEKHARTLKVRTEVANFVRDHRLRVLFPTSRRAANSFADTPFAAVERSIHIPGETALWQERVNEEKAFTSWCGVADADGGLALLSPWGLHEYAVLDDDDRTLAVTLFRSFFKTVFQAAETEGEIQQSLTFEYQLLPFAGDFAPVEAGRLVAAAQARVRVHTTHQLAPQISRMAIEGAVLLTALKLADDGDGVILRLWNPAPKPATARLQMGTPPREVLETNLREDPGDLIQGAEGAMITVVVPASGLYTIRCRW
ncbi:MAG: hypothetical protein IT368_06445, partial [Candidatus Hydrogenedentes bacterium]|nr:hypothetical protein [Candidatus Hydrogenedentota bacterium]